MAPHTYPSQFAPPTSSSPDDGRQLEESACALCLGLGSLSLDVRGVGYSSATTVAAIRQVGKWKLSAKWRTVLVVLVLSVLGPAGEQLARASGLI